jgi:hypothetical protein
MCKCVTRSNGIGVPLARHRPMGFARHKFFSDFKEDMEFVEIEKFVRRAVTKGDLPENHTTALGARLSP